MVQKAETNKHMSLVVKEKNLVLYWYMYYSQLSQRKGNVDYIAVTGLRCHASVLTYVILRLILCSFKKSQCANFALGEGEFHKLCFSSF